MSGLSRAYFGQMAHGASMCFWLATATWKFCDENELQIVFYYVRQIVETSQHINA